MNNLHELLSELRDHSIHFDIDYDNQYQYLTIPDVTDNRIVDMVMEYDYDVIKIERVMWWKNIYVTADYK